MTTVFDLSKRSIAVAASAALILASCEPAFAQRRKAEPEANPQFQQQLGKPASDAGAPIGEAAPALAKPGEGTEALVGGGDAEGGNVQGIQIGAAAPAKAAAPSAGTPLDARVTVRVKGAPLATFLDTISAQAKINFIITEGLESKRVTAFLQNVTVREALQVLLEIKGLSYQQIGHSNTYIVTPRSKQVENLITRIYTLNYVPLIPLEATQTGGSGGGAAGGGVGQPAAGPTAPPSQVQAFEVPIVKVLNSIISKLGQVAIDSRTNSLIVTDVPEVFPQIEQIITELDKKTPQIMIETQIVEINSDRLKELGIDWGGGAGQLATFTAGSRDTSFPLQLPNNLSNTRFLDPIANQLGNSIAGGTGNTNIRAGGIGNQFVGGLHNSILDLTQLQVALRALVTRTEGRFLGKPKILTLNNKPAVVQLSRNQAIFIQTTNSVVGGGVAGGTTAERVLTGLVLNVTPQINKDGYITMLLRPQFVDVDPAAISSVLQPVFDPRTRSVSTMVRVKNGQTIVLGGLLSTTEKKLVRKVPFFGYIPLIGWLFSSIHAERHNTDLVIFVTPTIVND